MIAIARRVATIAGMVVVFVCLVAVALLVRAACHGQGSKGGH